MDLTPYERAKLTERRIETAIKELGGEREKYLRILFRLSPAAPRTLGQRYKEAGRFALDGLSGNMARRPKYRDVFLRALAIQLSEVLAKPEDEVGV